MFFRELPDRPLYKTNSDNTSGHTNGNVPVGPDLLHRKMYRSESPKLVSKLAQNWRNVTPLLIEVLLAFVLGHTTRS